MSFYHFSSRSLSRLRCPSLFLRAAVVVMATAVLPALVACESEGINSLVDVGWNLNYRNWTLPVCDDTSTTGCAKNDVRLCDNVPAIEPSSFDTYPAVDSVEIHLNDPAREIPGFSKAYRCSDGIDKRLAPIIGAGRQKWDMEVYALDADGNTLYQYIKNEVDLTNAGNMRLDLQATTGEIKLFAMAINPDDYSCPANLLNYRFTFYEKIEGIIETDISHSITLSACSGGDLRQLYVRGIPALPTETFNGGFAANTYRMVVEGLDSSDTVLYCGVDENRAVLPGAGNLGGNLVLSAGPCTL